MNNKLFSILLALLNLGRSLNFSMLPTDFPFPDPFFFRKFLFPVSVPETRERWILKALRRAIRKDGFTVFYQVKVDCRTGQTAGFEALLRLKGMKLSPAVFIPVAERAGLMERIGRIVAEKAIWQLTQWREEGMELCPVSVNFSASQLCDQGYAGFLRDLLEQCHLPSSLLKIEITESILIQEREAAVKLFSDLEEVGIGVHLDDFGTGYSSLRYLTFLPSESVKLDKTLLDACLRREMDGKLSVEGKILLSDIIRMAHDLRKTIVVEGVEYAWQVEILKGFGCDQIQGFYYGQPQPGAEIPRLYLSRKQPRHLPGLFR